MSNTQQQASIKRTHPGRRLAIIITSTLILIAALIYANDAISQAMHDQQTQAALHRKPLTNITKIAIVNYEFQPANIQVKVGTTVTWTNQDNVAHTVTFRNGMKDSGLIQQHTSFSYTFTQVGTFTYYCDVHTEMIAQVTVVQ